MTNDLRDDLDQTFMRLGFDPPYTSSLTAAVMAVLADHPSVYLAKEA